MEKIKLTRTGNLPLGFEGEKVASSGGKWFAGRDQNRYHDLSLYKTQGGRYLLHIEYTTQWQGESNHFQAIDCGTEINSVAAELKAYDPVAHLIGYPAGQQYEDRQVRLIGDLRHRYDAQITELFAKINAEEKID